MQTPDLANIQGNPLMGFNTSLQLMVGLSLPQDKDIEAVRPFMTYLAGAVTSAKTVSANRAAIRDPERNGTISWLCAGISRTLVRRLIPETNFRSRAFNNGFFSRRDDVMGDRTDPKTWALGGSPDTEPDLFFIIAANVTSALQVGRDDVVARAEAAGFSVIYEELGQRLAGDKEHFGFRDGIAQPKPGQDKTRLGQFITGYEYIPGKISKALFASRLTDLSHDATFGVFRRLRQDRRAFRAFVKQQVQNLQDKAPQLKEDHLAALVVGRWPEGQVVDTQVLNAPPVPDESKIDDFTFEDDQDGQACPFGAHIRKVNPRSGAADVQDPANHAFLRRGIPYGAPLSDDVEDDGQDRGLLFLAFQASIDTGVDFVTANWMNHPSRPRQGSDLLVGRDFSTEVGGNLEIYFGPSKIQVHTPSNDWVTPTGGAYLFFPSLKGFSQLGKPVMGGLGPRLRGAMRSSALFVRDMAISLPGKS